MKGLFILSKFAYPLIYGEREREEIASLLEIEGPALTADQIRENPSLLADVEVIMSGWGGPLMDKPFLEYAPRLKAVFYGAGSVKAIVSEEFWQRGVILTSSWAANALPVAEFTEAAVVFSLKRVWHLAVAARAQRSYDMKDHGSIPGAYGARVGVVSLGKIGRLVCLRLLSHDLEVLAYDPFIKPDYAGMMGASLASLEEIFATSDVVTLHTPLLAETRRMIRKHHFESMKPNATFINTARGAIVHEQEMVEVLERRPDLWAVLDVTNPEPPAADSPLYTLPNVLLTPHLAGSHGAECRRMGRYAIQELKRFLAGEPLRWRVTRESAKIMA